MEQSSNSVFLTSSGRHIFLTELHLIGTYAGCLEGSAETHSTLIRAYMKESVRRYWPYAESFVVLDNGEDALPPCLWVAEFQCIQAVHTSHPDYSSRLIVCWFTHDVPNSLSNNLQSVIDSVNYDANAEDYDTTNF